MQHKYHFRTADRPKGGKETFGARLRRLRTERNISQIGFARMLGVSKPTVWKWERDEVRPRPKSLMDAASILGVSEGELIASNAKESDGESASQGQLRDIVKLCKAQIAEIAGTGTDSVLITIHV